MATLSDLYADIKTLCEQWFYNKSTIDSQMNNKVDKVSGKGLSTNDYTTNEKNKLAGIEAQANKTVVDTALSSSSTNPVQNKVINTALGNKVDKVSGKGLSTNDYTTTEKNKLAGIEAQANKTVVDTSLSDSSNNPLSNSTVAAELLILKNAIENVDDRKVEIQTGKGLSTNDFTNTYKTKLDNLDTNLSSKNVTVEKLGTAETGYLASYIIKQNGTQVGSTINIPKDYLVKSGSVKTVTAANTPVSGYVVGDKYIDLVINTKTNDGTDSHLYIKVTDLVDTHVDWSNIDNKPSAYTPSTHVHELPTNGQSGDIKVVEGQGQAYHEWNLLEYIGNTRAGILHSHGNIQSNGKITTTGTSGGNMVITDSTNKVAVDTTINVIDALVQDLITYGSS